MKLVHEDMAAHVETFKGNKFFLGPRRSGWRPLPQVADSTWFVMAPAGTNLWLDGLDIEERFEIGADGYWEMK